MEDALEEVVGEIYDEHDDNERDPIEKTGENSYRIKPDVSIEQLFEYLEIEHLPETEYSSVGGMVYELLENLPSVGASIKVQTIDDILNEHNDYISIVADLTFTVEGCEDDRITDISLVVERTTKDSDEK